MGFCFPKELNSLGPVEQVQGDRERFCLWKKTSFVEQNEHGQCTNHVGICTVQVCVLRLGSMYAR